MHPRYLNKVKSFQTFHCYYYIIILYYIILYYIILYYIILYYIILYYIILYYIILYYIILGVLIKCFVAFLSHPHHIQLTPIRRKHRSELLSDWMADCP